MKAVRIAILGEIATALTQLKAPPSAIQAERLTKSSAKELYSALKLHGAPLPLLAIVDRWSTKGNDAETLQALQAFNVAGMNVSVVGAKADR